MTATARSQWRRWRTPVVVVACLVPLGVLVGQGATGGLGANPIETVIHTTGLWALRLLLVTLAITPLRRWFGLDLVALRRPLGLMAFAYACLHLLAYVGLDQFFDWPAILADITKRNYILLGVLAFLALLPLAVTSTRAMMRRLGRNWKRLHRLVYPATMVAIAHWWLLVKADWREPAIHGAILVVLLAARWRPPRRPIRFLTMDFSRNRG